MTYSHGYLESIAKTMGNSFYIFDSEKYKMNFMSFLSALRNEYQRSEIAYSLKANYLPEICRLINMVNGMCEVVSRLEYDIALSYVDPEKVFFNGPVKSKEDIIYALNRKSIINIDSFNEIEILNDIHTSYTELNVGIRFNSNTHRMNSRFGFNYDDGSLQTAIDKLNKINNLHIICLHSHYSTREKSLDLFHDRAEKSIEVCSALNLKDLKYINIGGGYFGEMPSSLMKQFNVEIPSFSDYAETIGSVFRKAFPNNGPVLIIEPGISIVGNAMDFIVKVYGVKKMHNSVYVQLNSNINTINPTRSEIEKTFYIVKRDSEERRDICEKQILVGNTCMEDDIISTLDNKEELLPGDFLVFLNRGAYSNNHTPPFIVPQPGIIDIEGRVLKNPDDMSTILSSYI